MHDAMATETVDEVETFDVRRGTDDRVMVRSHLVKPGPRAPGIDAGFGKHGHTRSCMRQNFFDERRIEFSFKAGCLCGIVPCEQYSLPFTAKMKAGGHVDDHRKS